MTSVEFNFLADQRGPRKMICENYVDRQWKKTAVRKRKQLESFRKREARAKEEVKRMEKVELTDEMVDEVFQTICNDDDDDDDDDNDEYIPALEEEEERGTVIAKRRRLVNSSAQNARSDIPERYQHIRDSIQRVRFIVYLLVPCEEHLNPAIKHFMGKNPLLLDSLS